MSWLRRVGRLSGARPGLILAATVLVFGAGGLLLRYGVEQAQRTGFDGVPPPQELQEAMSRIFLDDRCIGVADAERMIRSTLDELGLEHWTIERRSGAERSECVTPGLNGEAELVELTVTLGPDVNRTIEALKGELLRDCHAKDDAAHLVESALVEEGLEGWDVRTDGPIIGPADGMDEIRRHVERGCWILSTTGWTAEGTPIVWLGGR